MNNVDYKAVIEIIENFLNNKKVEILGISVGEEYQLRQAIENLLKERQEDKERIKELEEQKSYNTAYSLGKAFENNKWKSLVREKMKWLYKDGKNYFLEVSDMLRCHGILQELLGEE